MRSSAVAANNSAIICGTGRASIDAAKNRPATFCRPSIRSKLSGRKIAEASRSPSFEGRTTRKFSSFVFAHTPGEPKRVETRDSLSRYFSEAQLESPRFEKAYRWSDGSLLVVRGIGRQSSEPHDLFGYELLVDSEHPNDPAYVCLIRGYVKAASAK